MSELRWALLIIGLLILLGIYFYHQWKARSEVNNLFMDDSFSDKDVLIDEDMVEENVDNLRKDNFIDQSASVGSASHTYGHSTTTEITPLDESESRQEPDLFTPQDNLNQSNSEESIQTASSLQDRPSMAVMHIVAEKDNPFEGKAVVKALQAHKLRFGEHQIYHRLLEEDGNKLTIYSVANMVKPGTLDPESLKSSNVPGLTFILNLPAPIESLKAYDDMLHAAQHMASTLEGSLLDEEFMTLSREKIALDRAKLF